MTYYSALHYAAKAEKSAREAATYNYKNVITNCITEIPQDIKLELNNGTLTLKAGSKVYVPNGKDSSGNNVFDEVVINVDRSLTRGFNDKRLVFVSPVGGLSHEQIIHCHSGTTQSSETYSYQMWYDTANNLLKITSDGGTTWSSGYSLPICVEISANNVVDSIDQVFNGFGYIGSTVYALPGVKGLIPNGRNADGSLKNIELVTKSVMIANDGSYQAKRCRLYVRENELFSSPIRVYDNKTNYICNGNTGVIEYEFEAGSLNKGTNGVISNFTPKQAFHAVDRNDSSWIAGQAMPSNKYIDLTLGATYSTYTAPANGWFFVAKKSGSVTEYISIQNNVLGLLDERQSPYLGATMAPLMYAKKGEEVQVNYTASGTLEAFRFYYAEGEN